MLTCARTYTSDSHGRLRDLGKITELHVLAKTNETLLIGWKRPAHDNGAFISHYQMELRDARDNRVSDQSMEVDRKSGVVRTNYMYIFVNLEPGECARALIDRPATSVLTVIR